MQIIASSFKNNDTAMYDQSDGPTSIYKKDGSSQDYYHVTILRSKVHSELQQLENILYAHCKLHFLNSNDCDDVRKLCKTPITIFASSPNFYYAKIDEDNDFPDYYIGVIPKSTICECYPVIRGMANFMRLIICYPLFVKELNLSQSENQTVDKSRFEEMRNSLLNEFRLTPITLNEFGQIILEAKTYVPIMLNEESSFI